MLLPKSLTNDPSSYTPTDLNPSATTTTATGERTAMRRPPVARLRGRRGPALYTSSYSQVPSSLGVVGNFPVLLPMGVMILPVDPAGANRNILSHSSMG